VTGGPPSGGRDQLRSPDPGCAVLGTFYLTVLPGWLGLDTQDVQFSTWETAKAALRQPHIRRVC